MKEVNINSVLLIINENIKDVVITADQADEDLSQLGMDSITFISIAVALEETFEIEIPDEKLLITEMGTLHNMVSVVLDTLEKKNEEGAAE